MRAWFFYCVPWIVCGSLLGLAFLHPWLWWLALPGLVLAIVRARNAENAKEAFLGGAIAGTVKILFALNWLWAMGFGDLLQMSSFFALMFAIGFVWVGSSLAMGLPFGLCTLLVYLSKGRRSVIAYLPFVLVLSELLSAISFGLFTLGSTSSLISADFTFGYLGYTLAHHYWLGQAALFGGVYALSFLITLMALILAELYVWAMKKGHVAQLACVSVAILVLAAGVMVPAAKPGTTLVATVYTFYTANNEASKRARIDEQDSIRTAVRSGLSAGAQYVVLPETVSAFSDHTDPEPILAFLKESTERDVVLIDSFVAQEVGEAATVAAAIYDSGSGESHIVQKQYLLPYGEYFPYHMALLFRVAGISTETVLEGRTLYDEGSTNPGDVSALWPRVLFCSENISPYLAFSRARNTGTPFIAHMVSHGWFRDPDTLWNQLDMMMKTNARFSRTPIVQAGNSTPPRAFDAYGRSLEPNIVYSSGNVATVMYGI